MNFVKQYNYNKIIISNKKKTCQDHNNMKTNA